MSKLRGIIRDELRKYLNEQFKLNPQSSLIQNDPLIYLTMSKSYAMAYANGVKNAAHAYNAPIENGLLFYVCADEITEHYGGDNWLSGFKDDIISDLENYIETYDYSDFNKETKDFIYIYGVEDLDDLTIDNVDYILSYIREDDLSIVPPVNWSLMQGEYLGYSEICLKKMPDDIIIKVELYENKVLVETINGKADHECANVFYHGSPLKNWKV